MARYYRIAISGDGGEAVTGKLTPEEYDYWKNQADQRREEFGIEEDEIPFEVYILSADDERWDSVPEEFRREYWNECDDLLHVYGPTLRSEVTIEELDSDDLYDGEVVDTVVIEGVLEEFIDENDVDVEHIYFSDWAPCDTHTVCGFSQEKGVMFSGLVKVEEGEFDLNKLSFKTYELVDGETLVTEVHYDDEHVDNDGSETRGIALYIELYDA
jgi:hypothetical protein